MANACEEYRLIPLSQGLFAIVDATDYEWLSQYKWFARRGKGRRNFYAFRNTKIVNWSKSTVILMHREIIGLTVNDPRQVDHINTAMTLDNRRSNLRIATRSEQQHNRRMRLDNTSGYKGVSLDHQKGKYQARIAVDGKRIWLGYRDTAKEAFEELYVPAAEKYHKKFARTK